MSDTYDIPSGVVLDGSQMEALLYCAVQEGLLDNDPSIGNGFVARLIEKPPPSIETVRDIFEQLVIGGRIISAEFLPTNWPGELTESGFLAPWEFIPEERLVKVSEVSPVLVLRLAKWYEPALTLERFRQIYNELVGAQEEWQAQAPGRSHYALSILWDLPGGKKDVSKELETGEMQAFERYLKAEQAATPIVKAIKQLRRVLTCSLEADALSSVPIAAEVARPVACAEVEDSESRQVMLEVHAKELARHPIGATLRDTLALSRTNEAMELRKKMAEWAALIRQSSNTGYERVLDDIRAAQRELKYGKRAGRLGTISTVVGVVALGATPIFPVAGAIGAVCTVVGGLSLGAQETIKVRNKWALYGAK
jgi:hypothetical protein